MVYAAVILFHQAMQSCFPVFGPTSHLKMTVGGEVWIQLRLQNADTCVSKEPKYRGLDGEDNECRLCKHCMWLRAEY